LHHRGTFLQAHSEIEMLRRRGQNFGLGLEGFVSFNVTAYNKRVKHVVSLSPAHASTATAPIDMSCSVASIRVISETNTMTEDRCTLTTSRCGKLTDCLPAGHRGQVVGLRCSAVLSTVR